jgi:hypothetical protein
MDMLREGKLVYEQPQPYDGYQDEEHHYQCDLRDSFVDCQAKIP